MVLAIVINLLNFQDETFFSILAATVLFVATSSTTQAQDEGAKEFAAYSGVLVSAHLALH